MCYLYLIHPNDLHHMGYTTGEWKTKEDNEMACVWVGQWWMKLKTQMMLGIYTGLQSITKIRMFFFYIFNNRAHSWEHYELLGICILFLMNTAGSVLFFTCFSSSTIVVAFLCECFSFLFVWKIIYRELYNFKCTWLFGDGLLLL